MKIIYDKEVVLMVIHVYRKNSEIYRAMMNGEKISGMVKKSFKTKGCNYRIRDQKTIYKLCKQAEEQVVENEQSVSV